MATMTPGLSATQLARQLGVQQRTAWFMLQRLRRGMVNTFRSKLSGVIETDESILGGTAVGFHSRGTTKAPHKSLILGAVEVERYKTKAGGIRLKASRLRLEVAPDASSSTIKKFMEKNVESGSVIFTDGWRGYSKTALADYVHHAQAQGGPANASKLAPHIHRVFSDLKTWLTGTHHGVDPKYLQNYLDEFVFRFNRRQVPMAAFQTLLGITSTKPHETLPDIRSWASNAQAIDGFFGP